MATLFHCPWDGNGEWLEGFRAAAPEIEFRVWPDIGAPQDIDSAVVWKLPAGELKALPNLKCICSLGAGVDHIFSDPDLPRGVPVTRLVDPVMGRRMAEYVLAEILRRQRNLDAYLEQQRRRAWRILPQPDAGEITVGIMGLGVLGGAVARTLASLGYDVAGWSQSPKSEPDIACFHGQDQFPAFLARSHYVVCLLPLTSETRGILNREIFAAMPRGGHIINVGRGDHLVEADLLAALDDGTLSGATLDVMTPEPLPADHPFWTHPKIVVTPHVSSLSNPRTAIEQITANLRRCRRGEPLKNVADPGRKY
jgi:glyoxylate/hydroxypyruvate reductase A